MQIVKTREGQGSAKNCPLHVRFPEPFTQQDGLSQTAARRRLKISFPRPSPGPVFLEKSISLSI